MRTQVAGSEMVQIFSRRSTPYYYTSHSHYALINIHRLEVITWQARPGQARTKINNISCVIVIVIVIAIVSFAVLLHYVIVVTVSLS